MTPSVEIETIYKKLVKLGLIGIPYRKGADTLEGADCWGVVRLGSRLIFGRELPPDPREAARHVTIVERRDRRAGDVIIMRIYRDLHAGLMVERDVFLHVMEGGKSDILVLDPAMMNFTRAQFYRWRG